MRKIIILLSLLSVPVHANVVWPALYLEMRLFSWWAIMAGLVIEFLFIKWLFHLSYRKSFWADVSANFASALLGIIFIPLAGLLWELFPGLLLNRITGLGTFNPVTWFWTFLSGCLINAYIESIVYKKVFQINFDFKSKTFLWLLLANAISVAVALLSLFVKPMR